jgi:Tol biopolymer transport system component
LKPTGELQRLIPSNRIAVRDPEISNDGERVIFAMKEGGDGKWQIWECRIDGTELRKISRNSEVNDFDPAYLPDRKIIFVSDRRQLADPLKNYPSGQMHIMNANGTGVKLLNAKRRRTF